MKYISRIPYWKSNTQQTINANGQQQARSHMAAEQRNCIKEVADAECDEIGAGRHNNGAHPAEQQKYAHQEGV